MDRGRRKLLEGGLALGTAGVAMACGLVVPRRARASTPRAGFQATAFDQALSEVTGGLAVEDSARVQIEAPEVAESGAQVPVTVSTDIEGAESLCILVQKNPRPLAARFVLGPGAEAYGAVRVKMGESSTVVATVHTPGKVYLARREIKVTVGGCA